MWYSKCSTLKCFHPLWGLCGKLATNWPPRAHSLILCKHGTSWTNSPKCALIRFTWGDVLGKSWYTINPLMLDHLEFIAWDRFRASQVQQGIENALNFFLGKAPYFHDDAPFIKVGILRLQFGRHRNLRPIRSQL